MGFAVFHIEKVTTGASSLGAHIDRSPGQEYTYKNADPNLLQKNVHFTCGSFNELKLNEAINLRIKQGYTGGKAIRKDAVKGMSMVFTGSHEEMKKIFSQSQTRNAWIDANIKFVKDEFGVKNIVRFTLHLDEKTPHIHAVVVPLTKDGRLSAKEIMGDKNGMSERQTRYAEQMRPFGLERGVVGSKAIHNSEGWYLGQQKKEQEAVLSHIPAFTFLDKLSPTNYINNLTEGLKLAVKQKKDAELLAQSREKSLILVRESSQNSSKLAEKEILKLRNNNQFAKKSFEVLLKESLKKDLSPEEQKFSADLKAEYLKFGEERKVEKAEEQHQNKGRGMRR